ncbi:MAG: hypothetical protein MJ188_01880 [Treponema sp.]|nr:hypothetical protein [Treponema sp.]
MKKLLLGILCFSIFGLFAFANENTENNYKITNIEYNINPSSWSFLTTTKVYALEQNVSLDKNTIFKSEEDLKKYINDYKQRLSNLRAFDSIQIDYTISEEKKLLSSENSNNNSSGNPDASYFEVQIKATLTDSIPLLAVPYGTYNSNSGTVFKLKAKDTNFLGSLNPMTADFDLQLEQPKENAKMNYIIGANFEYDYPFKAGIFNTIWVNDYAISYTFGEDLPEWNAKTGLKFLLSREWVSYSLEFYQSVINDYDYEYYGDNIYFQENARFSIPVKIFYIPNWGKITYTPYIDFVYNWDKTGISNLHYNYSLSGPYIVPGQTISTSRINWSNNLRTGLSGTISNCYEYNFDRKLWYPYISFTGKAFKAINIYDGNWFSRFGLCSQLYAFNYFTDRHNEYIFSEGNSIGSNLRGIRDNQKYIINGARTSSEALKTVSAVCVNLDVPIHIFSTDFSSKYLRYFNFDLQFSPFFDFALLYNKATEKKLDPKDGFYSAGLEVLVFPQKWSSYTVRASVGYDIGRAFFADKLNTDWRENVSKFEISFGLGLHY